MFGVFLRWFTRLNRFWLLRDRGSRLLRRNYCRRPIPNASHQIRAGGKDDQHRCQRKPTAHELPVNRAARIIRETCPQTKIKIRRRRNGTEAADYLSQAGLLPLKLATFITLAQVRGRGRTARLIQHQLIKFLTNHSTIIFSHNTFTYK